MRHFINIDIKSQYPFKEQRFKLIKLCSPLYKTNVVAIIDTWRTLNEPIKFGDLGEINHRALQIRHNFTGIGQNEWLELQYLVDEMNAHNELRYYLDNF